MFPPGAAAVPSSACLRCQLRCVLQHLRRPTLTPRRQHPPRQHFSTIHRQQAEDGIYFKHITPGSRIVGKPGRKQRQTSQALAISSLGEKSEIVIFRDVIEDRNSKISKSKELKDVDFGEEGLKGLSLTSEQIKAALSETDQAPDEEDVNASIDALRPEAPVLGQEEFDRLIKELLDSYNVAQLSRYLRRSLSSKQSLLVHRSLKYSAPGSTVKRQVTFTRSRWQPGRTPLEKRRISEISSPQGASLPPKARAAERIVRVAWQVAIDAEEKQLGELEMQMKPWQLSLFFDVLTRNQRPKFESLIQPPLLLRNAEVRPYRRDGIIRITARRKDAEDIASQLENEVLRIGKLSLDLKTLTPHKEGTAAATKRIHSFRPKDIDIISQRTQSVLITEADGKIGIYSYYLNDRYNARRLLLGLLDIASRKITSVTLPAEMNDMGETTDSAQKPFALIPVYPEDGLHFRHRFKSFARATVPLQRKSSAKEGAGAPAPNAAGPLSTRVDHMSRAIAPLIQKHDRMDRGFTVSPYWGTMPYSKVLITNKTWTIQLGQLLQEVEPATQRALFKQTPQKSGGPAKAAKDPVWFRHVPGFETLLSYFVPKNQNKDVEARPRHSQPQNAAEEVARSSDLIAHFVPSPFTRRGAEALVKFPRLELTFHRSWSGKPGKKTMNLKVESLRAIIDEEAINIPMPGETIDLRLNRQSSFYAPKESIAADPEIQDFASILNASAKTGTALHGKSDVTFEVPAWMAKPRSELDQEAQSGEPEPDLAVPYLFDRFEQTQSTRFYPNMEALNERAQHNSTLEQFKDSIPAGTHIRYKEIEAGAIGGRHTDISLGFQPVENTPPKKMTNGNATIDEDLETNNAVLKYVLTPGLAVVDLVTKACKGEILSWMPGRAFREGDAQKQDPSFAQDQGDETSNDIEGLQESNAEKEPDSVQQTEGQTALETPEPEDIEVNLEIDAEQESKDASSANAAKAEKSVELQNQEPA